MRPGSTDLQSGGKVTIAWREPFSHFCPELREAWRLIHAPGPHGPSMQGPWSGWWGWQLAVSGAPGMRGDLQEQWVLFWGADIRQWGYM